MRHTILHARTTILDTRSLLALSLAPYLALAACTQPSPEPVEPSEPSSAADGEAIETVSILRPEIEPPEVKPTPEEVGPYQAVIGFPEGGTALDEAALAALEAALASEQLGQGLPITLGAHGDSEGTDSANLKASEKRGLAVAKWLIDNGVDAARITVIAFGEQNPVQPNANPDGSPNEEGRAANRRVEITITAQSVEESAAENSKGSVEASD